MGSLRWLLPYGSATDPPAPVGPTATWSAVLSLRRPIALLAAAALVLSLAPAGASPPPAVPAVGDLPPVRVAGGDRVATGEALARAWAATGRRASTAVVVAAGDTPAALASAGLAGHLGGVTVLSADPPRASTADAVRATGADAVVVVGDPAMAAAWAAMGFAVTSVPGGGPDAAAAMAEVVTGSPAGRTAGRALLVGTGGLPDAVAVGPSAWAQAVPVLLTGADALDPAVADLVRDGAVSAVTIVGGTAVVGQAVQDELAAMGVAVDRVAGADREQTALALSGPPGAAGLLVAAGDDPADAAAAAAYAAAIGRPVLPPGPQVAAALAARCGQVGPIGVLGGTAAVPPAAAQALRTAAQRCDGLRAPMAVRVGVATPGAEGSAAAVMAAIAGPDGWGSRRVRFTGVADAAHVGVLVGDPGACGGPAACARGTTLVLDGARWAAGGDADRARLVAHVIGWWLGERVAAGCDGTVMDPLDCPAVPAVDAGARAAVADRFVPTARLSFAGDVHGERHIATAVAQGRNPLGPVAAHLSAADLAVLNLETPLSDRGAPVPKTYTFRGPPAMAADLAEAGVDVVSLANNHALDYGVDALLDTLVHTAAAGVATVGAGPDAASAYAPVVRDTPAGRVAVVGLTRVLHTRTWEAGPGRPGLASAYDEAAAVAAVQAARAAADHVVVAIHWGTERADCPDATQRHLAVLLTDAGADLVIGHHAHVLQGVQARGGALIAYSLGNFVWYHDAIPSRFTGILDVELPLLDDPAWSFAPAQIGTDGSPHPAGGTLGAAITARLVDRSPGGAVGCAFPG